MYCFVLAGVLGQLFIVYTIYQIQKSDDIDTVDDVLSTNSSTSNLSGASTINLSKRSNVESQTRIDLVQIHSATQNNYQSIGSSDIDTPTTWFNLSTKSDTPIPIYQKLWAIRSNILILTVAVSIVSYLCDVLSTNLTSLSGSFISPAVMTFCFVSVT